MCPRASFLIQTQSVETTNKRNEMHPLLLTVMYSAKNVKNTADTSPQLTVTVNFLCGITFHHFHSVTRDAELYFTVQG